MNRSLRTIAAVLLSLGMLVLPSCGKKEPVTSPSVTSAAPAASSAASSAAPSASEPEKPSESGTLPAPVFAYEGQLEVIAAAKSTWYVEGDGDMRYAITDLDMNGRYEITAAKKNKAFSIYEVTEDKSGVTKLKTPFEAGSPGPYMEEEYKLRMNSDGEYLYVAREYDDALNDGEETIYYYVMSLANGVLRANQVATEIRVTDENGNVTSRYGDDEFETSAEDFKVKTDTGLPKIEHIQKVSWGDDNSVAGMNDAKSLEAICFKLTK